MTTPNPERPADARAAARELIGLALLVLGVLAVAGAAFAFDWRLGTALLGSAAAVIGFNLSTVKE